MDRQSVAEEQALLTDPDAIARQEVENGVRQFGLAIEMIRGHVKDPERPFRLRTSHILQLHAEALKGIHRFSGTFRNTKVSITKSSHVPPEPAFVSEEVTYLCEYINRNFE